ncbi:MAG: 3-hydroxyisobutyrate dehydrogenase [marine bacterium B5-7]|nr:MAG: 3-hydroxyisobutyrate dehydrogenase [marine bacterium B5-7]
MTIETSRYGTIGVAGCGAMGLPMAQCLVLAGFDVVGFDVRPRNEFGEFAALMIEDPVRFSKSCDMLISVVRDARQTFDLCFDQQGVLASGTTIRRLIISSTLAPRVVEDLGERLDSSIDLIDAPMSGAPSGARRGDLTFMVGATSDEFEDLCPLFESMGKHIHYCGSLGAGMSVKVLNNYVAVSSVVAVRRVLDAATRLGIDPVRLRQIMSQSSGSTWYGDRFDEIPWSREGYQADNTIGILEKDLAAACVALSEAGDASAPGFIEDALATALRNIEPYDSD